MCTLTKGETIGSGNRSGRKSWISLGQGGVELEHTYEFYTIFSTICLCSIQANCVSVIQRRKTSIGNQIFSFLCFLGFEDPMDFSGIKFQC